MENIYQEIQMEQKYVEIAKRVSDYTEGIKLHSHHFYEIIFILKGSCDYIIGDREYQVTAGNIILLPPHLIHQPILCDQVDAPYERYILWIQKDFLEHLLLIDPTILYCFEHCKASNHYILTATEATIKGLELAFLNSMEESTKKKNHWEICNLSIIISLIAHLSRTFERLGTQPATSHQDTVLEQLVSYIDLHLHEKITIKEMAQALHLSPSSLSHIAKQKLNISLYQFILQRRLIMAKNNILSGIPIQTAWENLGFSDYSNFFRAFKKEFGVSPTALKKLYAESSNK